MSLINKLLSRGLLAAGLLVCSLAVQAATVLFVSTSPVSPGKFNNLANIAKTYDIQVESRFVERLAADIGSELFSGADLVVFDAPRDHIEAYIRTRLAGALPPLEKSGKPFIWISTKSANAGALPDGLPQRLHDYYVNGGRSNFENFFRTLQAHFDGKPWAEVTDPIIFPPSAVYHPEAPQLVFDNAAAYFTWRKIDLSQQPHPAVVAIAMHQQYIAAEQTAFIDHLIRDIEAEGAIALPFYSPVMDADAITNMVTLDGKPVADVIINTQIMLNPEGRRKEFEALGIPVIQAMPYRKGDESAWRADPHGVALMDVPFYLAQAEYAGVTDIQIAAATRKSDEQIVAIDAQALAIVKKAVNLAKLQHTDNRDKRIVVFFWNYPPGEKNLSASFMNLPRSLDATLAAMREAGYQVPVTDENRLIMTLQRLLAPYYRPPEDQAELRTLLNEGLAERLPVKTYSAWLKTLPADVQNALNERWGAPEKSSMVLRLNGEAFFIVPRLKMGNVSLLPQAPRGERGEDKEKSLYHSTSAIPSHFYLASYLWAKEQAKAHALVHYGTHGNQEWLPGKERGLSVHDYPMLAIGDVPVVYPYIVDNIGEATQAKRRGRAVIISHQTPPFAPAGLHASLTHIHDQLHAWIAQDEGAVKEKIKADFLQLVRKERIDKDMGWSAERIANEFPAFVTEVHDHLHELARTAQPMGLHTFGRGADEQWRMTTVLMMMGKDFWEAVAGPGEEADEMLVGDYTRLTESTAYKRLQQVIHGNAADDATLPEKVQPLVAKARGWYRDLGARNEITAFLSALDGRYIPTSYGGDPIKNPDALPTGRNLYAFDPSRVPTKAAWEAGKEALENLLATHRTQTGKIPKKLTFTLWSVETMRHFGMLEAQALWAMGVEPVWDAGGRVTDVQLVPREKLGRPRVDVVLSATGLYRDHFPNVMKQLAKAAKLAAEADEVDNPVAENSRRIASQLQKQGVSAEAALRAGQTRIFSSESGRYGTGLDDAAPATDTWKGKEEGDRKLAQLYLSRMQFAYGPDEAEWGQPGDKGVNLYAEHLKGTEGAVLARTSNLYGMLTTDDPFQYLGGIGLAVRHLDGKAPELYISNLRGSGSGKVEGAAQFLAKELATRNFHPGYIEGLKREGYAGTLQVLDGINNFWGWQATSREIVRDDQWEEFVDVYVRDKHKLGLKQWFESKNPHALAQSIERMLEAARQGYWQADPATVKELKNRYQDLANRYDVRTDNAAFNAYVATGFGLQSAQQPAAQQAPESAQEQAEAQPQTPAPPPPIQGIKLERVEEPQPSKQAPLLSFALALLALSIAGGAGRAWRT
ncbi:cobaltochelatase CobN [Methylophilaceae bacterium]|nr:cobaltochelatase CobN [Methylophilaceae bacterium]